MALLAYNVTENPLCAPWNNDNTELDVLLMCECCLRIPVLYLCP